MEIPLDTSSLPPGFGFHPTDVELISHYLKRKIMGYKTELEVIPVVDIYKHEPWDLPAKTKVSSRDCKWHFFNTRDRKYPTGSRTNRATEAGYWKSTGKDRVIRSRNRVIGTKKTLVFHQGRPPRGKRTDWIMHEYYLDESECKAIAAGFKELFVLCRVTKRDGMGDRDEEERAVEMGDTIPPRQMNFPSAPEHTRDVNEHGVVEDPQPQDLSMEAWVAELYDPNFGAVPAATACKIEVETDPVPGYFAPTQQPFPLDAVNPSLVQSDELYFSQELDASFLRDWNTELGGLVDDDLNYSTPRSNFAGEIDRSTSETGIIIRQREATRRFDSAAAAAPGPRIKLQMHKMEAKNPVATNHTVMLDSSDHQLDQVVISYDRGDAEARSGMMTFQHPPAVEEEEEEEEVRRRRRTCGKSNPAGGSSRRLRSGIRGMVRRAFKEAHVLTRRCSPIGMNCLFLGTCLSGATAFGRYDA